MAQHRAYTDSLVGRRVQVIAQSGRYAVNVKGESGTIKAVWSPINVAVKLDYKNNKNSGEGYFYFMISELEIFDIRKPNDKTAVLAATEKGEKTMTPIRNYVNLAKVQFLNDTKPFNEIECANYNTNLAVGDLCVVQSAHHGMGLAEVIEIVETNDKELFREVVSRVDTAEYDRRVAQRQKAAELKAKMQERAKQLQDIAIYQMLSKEDTEMAQMLEEYKGLTQN